jgi:hypothetical protein
MAFWGICTKSLPNARPKYIEAVQKLIVKIAPVNEVGGTFRLKVPVELLVVDNVSRNVNTLLRWIH